MNELDILDEAFGQLKRNTGITAEWNLLPQRGLEETVDAELTIRIDGKEIKVYAEVKHYVQPYQLDRFIRQSEKNQPLLVIAERVYPGMKELLRQNGIGYLDVAGNVYLHVGDQLIWIEGQKSTKPKNAITNRAFTRAGLQVVFYLLQHPDAINDPYRRLAEHTGVALGNIGYIIDGLKLAGYILELDKKRKKMVKKGVLLDRWIEGYRDVLKPTLHLGNFRLTDINMFYDREGLIGRIENTVWGGEPGAEILTHHIHPGVLTTYTGAEKKALMQTWKLIPEPAGNIHLYHKFWKDQLWDDQKIVPPLLLYADLILTGDPRNIETGNLIYHQYLEKNELE